ncbi:MAG TPA: hypothetical protein PLA54_07480 [Spirochaetota bacterium]|nr:hypothetical protein [Spirochaetota bacterium]HQE59015.1 hypothetical protein [Spirochaetota bacterium]
MKKYILMVFVFGFLSAENLIDYSNIFYKMRCEQKDVASTYYVDDNYDKDKYSPDKAFDSKNNTAWVVSTDKSGIGEYIYVFIQFGDEGDSFPKKSTIKIKNGLFTNKSLYYANNRLKSAKLEIYECDVLYGQDAIRLRNKPVLNMTMKLDFDDEMVEQQFDIIIEKPKPQVKAESHQYFYFGKLIITDIYKGSKYNDTCISEIETESFK